MKVNFNKYLAEFNKNTAVYYNNRVLQTFIAHI